VSVSYNSSIVTNGLVLCLDAGSPRSYPSSGTVWNDVSGTGNNGTLVNGVGYDSSNSGSLVFDGVNDYVNVPYGSTLDTPAGATYSIWIYPIGTGEFLNRGTSDAGSSPDNPRFYINVTQRDFYFDWSVPGNDRYVNTSAGSYASNNAWVNVVGTATPGGRLEVYVNGVMATYSSRVNADIMPNPLPNTNDPIQIGSATWIPRYFTGRISSVCLYNRALSASEVTQNFNALRGRYGI
jgi:hypothetical protein